jgi:hypothetical protein
MVAVLLSVAAAVSADDGFLRYKWAEGLGAAYSLAFTSSGKATIGDETRAWKASWTAEVNVTIETANAEGIADVRFKLGPMKGKQTVVDHGDTTFDIDPEGARAVVVQDGGDPMTLEVTDELKQALAAGFSVTMDDRGNVMSMQGNERIDTFLLGLPSMGGLPDMAGLVKVMFPILPDKAVAEGNKWEEMAAYPMLRERLGVKVKFAWAYKGEGDVDGRACEQLGLSLKVVDQSGKLAAADNQGLAVEYHGLTVNGSGTILLSTVDTLPMAAKHQLTQPGKMVLHAKGKDKVGGREEDVDQRIALEGCASTAEVKRQ